MRKFLPLWLCAVWLITSGLTPSVYEKVTLAADSWCPYTCEKESMPGFMVEIVREALRPYNVYVDYKVMPWKEAIVQARTGTIDGIIGAAKGDAPDFIFPFPLQGRSEMNFWVRSDSAWNYDGKPSLTALRIGVAQDYSYGEALDSYIREQKANPTHIQSVVSENAVPELLHKLTSGEVDTIAEDHSVMLNHYAEQGKFMDIRAAGNISEPGSEDEALYVAFGPNNPKGRYYADLIGKRVPQMRQDGSLGRILMKYRVEDWYRITGK